MNVWLVTKRDRFGIFNKEVAIAVFSNGRDARLYKKLQESRDDDWHSFDYDISKMALDEFTLDKIEGVAYLYTFAGKCYRSGEIFVKCNTGGRPSYKLIFDPNEKEEEDGFVPDLSTMTADHIELKYIKPKEKYDESDPYIFHLEDMSPVMVSWQDDWGISVSEIVTDKEDRMRDFVYLKVNVILDREAEELVAVQKEAMRLLSHFKYRWL